MTVVLDSVSEVAATGTAAPELLFGVSRGGVVLDICAHALGGRDADLPLFDSGGDGRGRRGRAGRRLFASFDDDDHRWNEDEGFMTTVLGWNPDLRSQAELLAIARAVGDDLGRNRFRSIDALHYFELIRRS